MGGTTTRGVRTILRLEGPGVLILALVASSKWGMDWMGLKDCVQRSSRRILC